MALLQYSHIHFTSITSSLSRSTIDSPFVCVIGIHFFTLLIYLVKSRITIAVIKIQ